MLPKSGLEPKPPIWKQIWIKGKNKTKSLMKIIHPKRKAPKFQIASTHKI
jgi:hypothetical protein